jgi:hypothetical protein
MPDGGQAAASRLGPLPRRGRPRRGAPLGARRAAPRAPVPPARARRAVGGPRELGAPVAANAARLGRRTPRRPAPPPVARSIAFRTPGPAVPPAVRRGPAGTKPAASLVGHIPNPVTNRPAGAVAAPHGLIDRLPEVAAQRARQSADVFGYLPELVVPGHTLRLRPVIVVVIHPGMESKLLRWADSFSPAHPPAP